ncbi:ABC transporter permease [Aggregatilineales bacterium SYSU G02658]
MTQTTLSNSVANLPLETKVNAPPRRRPRRVNLSVLLSVAVLVVMTAAVLLADVLTPHRPEAINLRARLAPPLTLAEYPLGTDATGRDVLTRILHGGRVSLMVGVVSTLIGLALGTLLGVISGYFRGWLDEFIMYLVDVQLALPFVLLAVAVALVLGRSLPVLIGLAAISTWSLYARVIRGEVLSLREREFIVAARSLGARDGYIMLRHMLPNLAGPLLVLGTLSVGRIILLESGLSFLGIGVQPPTPSWGGMINDGRDYLSSAWWLATLPGIALMLLVLAVGTLGDWLRDRLDVAVS